MGKRQTTLLDVEHIGSWQFVVSSASRPKLKHQVDLSAPPHQLCSCENFTCKRGPEIKKGLPVEFNHCIHVKAVMDWLSWRKLFPMAQEQGKKDRNHEI